MDQGHMAMIMGITHTGMIPTGWRNHYGTVLDLTIVTRNRVWEVLNPP
jgi:hypothetical protein